MIPGSKEWHAYRQANGMEGVDSKGNITTDASGNFIRPPNTVTPGQAAAVTNPMYAPGAFTPVGNPSHDTNPLGGFYQGYDENHYHTSN
jgi:hypothetical protein